MGYRVVFVAACLLLWALPGRGQPVIPIGDSAIRGRVIDLATERPVADVVVRIMVDAGGPLTTVTDGDGRYAFEHLPPGNHRVEVEKSGFVAQLRLRPGELSTFGVFPATGGMRVGVERSQTLTGLDFTLTPAGSISGRVVTAAGLPLRGARLMLMLEREPGRLSSMFSSSMGTLTTNERGEYRINNLAPGLYHVSALWTDPSLYEFRGGTAESWTYHPATTDIRASTPVKVDSGRSVSSIDISIAARDLIRVRGTFLSGGGGHVEAWLLSGSSVLTVTTRSNGEFTTPVVRGGRYTLLAKARMNGESWEAAAVTLDLEDEFVGLNVPLLPTASITGRVVTEDGSPRPNEIQIAAVLADGDQEVDPYRRDRAYLESDGSFEIEGVIGPRLMRIVGVTAGWKISRVLVDKTPVTTLDVQPGVPVSNVVVVLAAIP